MNDDIYDACLAGETLPYCRQYAYPDVQQFPTGRSDSNTRRPGGSNNDVYEWGDKPEVLNELGTRKLATVARWQPELEYEVPLNQPGKHALAVNFFTPENVNGTHTLDITAKDNEDPECKYSFALQYIVWTFHNMFEYFFLFQMGI